MRHPTPNDLNKKQGLVACYMLEFSGRFTQMLWLGERIRGREQLSLRLTWKSRGSMPQTLRFESLDQPAGISQASRTNRVVICLASHTFLREYYTSSLLSWACNWEYRKPATHERYSELQCFHWIRNNGINFITSCQQNVGQSCVPILYSQWKWAYRGKFVKTVMPSCQLQQLINASKFCNIPQGPAKQ